MHTIPRSPSSFGTSLLRAMSWLAARGPVSLVAIAGALFAGTLLNGFVWDDLKLIVPNEAYRHADLMRILFSRANDLEYLPVRDLTLALDAAVWGMRPFGFHLTNLIIYLATGILLFRAVRSLAEMSGEARTDDLAFWTTLIFLLHPIHVEAVAFVAARNTLLSFLFSIGSLTVLIKGLREKRILLLPLSLVLLVAALFSKANMVFFPVFAAFILFYWPWPAFSRTVKLTTAAANMVIGAAAVYVHFYNARDTAVMNESIMRLGTKSWEYLAAKAMQIYLFYLKMLVVPFPLSVEYPPSIVDGRGALSISIALLFILGAAVWMYYLHRHGPSFVLTGIVWFVLSLVPVLNLFPTYPVVADRYAYPAVLGFSMACAYGIVALQKRRASAALAVVSAALVLWSGISVFRAADWRTEETLFRSSMNAYRGTSGIQYARVLWTNKQYARSLDVFRAEHERTGDHSYSQYLGKQLMMSGKPSEAIPLFQRSLEEGGDAYKGPHLDLAIAYEQTGSHALALRHYLKALETESGDIVGVELKPAQEGLERMRSLSAGQLADAHSRARSQPGNAQAQMALASLLLTLGQYEDAIPYYRAVADLAPERWEAWYNLGLAQLKAKNYRSAIDAFRGSLARRPENKDAWNTLGRSYALAGDVEQAKLSYQKALSIDPNYTYAAFNLARLHFAQGRADDAKRMFAVAARTAPGDRAMQDRIRQYLQQL